MTDLALAADFPRPAHEDWLKLVDRAIKGGDFERRLVSRTADGIRVQPLYTRADAIAGREAVVPGAAPFIRGTHVPDSAAWDVRQPVAEPDPVAANAAILDDLAGGTTSVLLHIAAPGSAGLGYEQALMARALQDVLLEVCPVSLVAGEYTPDAAGSLMALWRAAGLADGQRRGAFNYDPLGNLAATGALYHPLAKALAIAADLVATSLPMPGVTALRADGHLWHRAGATEAQELGLVVATLVADLRAAEARGTAPAAALPKIAVTLAADADQFLTIAKLRAARRLVWRVAEACGAGAAAGSVAFTAETSARMMARRDPWVNMLRTTIAAAAASMGGADAITVLPFTWSLGRPDAFARRIARNTHHVLIEEAGLGRVADPAGGSWYVERLTDELAAKAWEVFQAIEEKGGLGVALEAGSIQDDLAKAAEARARLIATGKLELTGTSAFPRLGDDGVKAEPWPARVPSADLNGIRVRPVVQRRDGETLEALRDAADAHAARTDKAPEVFLASLGPLAVHATRTTWMRNFLAAGGITGTGGDGWTATADLGQAFAGSGARIACLCSSDDVYGELGEAAASVLKAAGAERVYLAGRPREQEAALKAAGVDAFIFAGIDMPATLAEVQGALGIG
ncbi:MAG: methylmalonyl-CoA mutase family protein [Hyphomicrobiaceae bacterium]|nr:methylmalonyl-CoA mutase family protein [Hyphomicrobiaceae bacterium]